MDALEGGSQEDALNKKNNMKNDNIVAIVLIGAILVAPLVEGTVTQPHPNEVTYSTQTVSLVSTPATGLFPTSSSMYSYSGVWTDH